MPARLSYEIRLGTHLDEHWAAHLGDAELTHEPDGTTTLRCQVRDQAELHGLLARIRDLGADLVWVIDPGAITDKENLRCPPSPPSTRRPPRTSA